MPCDTCLVTNFLINPLCLFVILDSALIVAQAKVSDAKIAEDVAFTPTIIKFKEYVQCLLKALDGADIVA
jgi:hypothetical protein